jgi:hypothetical protein
MEATSLLLWILALPVAILIMLLVGSFVLQAACALCNVEDLRFFKALVLILVLILINAPLVIGIFFTSGFLASSLGWGKDAILGTSLALAYPLHWLISALVLFWPLHISFLKAVLIAIMQNVISLVLIGVLGGLIFVALALIQLVSAG